MSQPREFGQRLKELREARGLSVRGLARCLDCSHTQIVRWEQQAHAPKQISLERLAEALKCPVTELIPGSHETAAVTKSLPGGDEIATGTEPSAVTRKSPEPQSPVDELEQQLAALQAERDRLRALITEVAAAAKDRDDPDRWKASLMRLRQEAHSIELREMEESVDSIG